jgi:hypothetical protein
MKIKISPYFKNLPQKISIQIDNYDVWNMNNTISQIILPMLVSLKISKAGIPGDFAHVGGENWHNQLSFDFYQNTVDESFDIRCKEWEDTLDKMIWSFQEIISSRHEDFHVGESKYDFVKDPNTSYSRMVDLNPNDHYYDAAGDIVYSERIQEGIDLFAKYFTSLWD